MGFPESTAGRVSQSKYWALFGVYMIAVPVLLIGGIVAILQGSWLLGFLMVVAILPLGIYWRVIMMRRCRDIGWPAFLPWLIFGLQVAMSFNSPLALGAAGTPDLSALALPMALGLGDFVFSIVIGCMGTKQAVDYADVFGDGPATFQRTGPRRAESHEDGPDRFDEAIARALEARKQGAVAPVGGAPSPGSAPAHFARPSGGFGRRIV